VLSDWLEAAARRGLGRIALLATATLRREEAVVRLLAVVSDEPPALARDALAALATLDGGDALAARARSAAEGRPELGAALERAFGARQ